MRSLSYLAIVVSLSAVPTHAFAQTWSSEFGQGNTDAGISAGDAELKVGCAVNANLGSNFVTLSIDGAPVNGTVTFQTGRRAPITLPFSDGMYAAPDATTLEQMIKLVEGLRRSNTASVSVSGRTIAIPLRGSSAALANCPSNVTDVVDLGAAQPDATPQPSATQPATSQPTEVQPTDNPIALVEGALAALGYYPGPMDGKIDQALHVAIAAWQRDTGQPVTGALMVDGFQVLLAQAEAAKAN